MGLINNLIKFLRVGLKITFVYKSLVFVVMVLQVTSYRNVVIQSLSLSLFKQNILKTARREGKQGHAVVTKVINSRGEIFAEELQPTCLRFIIPEDTKGSAFRSVAIFIESSAFHETRCRVKRKMRNKNF